MENQIDKEWAVISRLIEKDKEAAWAVGRNQSPILYTRHRRRLHPLALSAALFVLALLVGSGIHLFRTPAAAIQNPLTFDRLPFFASLRSAAQDSPKRLSQATETARELALVLETVQKDNDTIMITNKAAQPGDPEEARTNIQRIIRENTLERFLTRVIIINQEVSS